MDDVFVALDWGNSGAKSKIHGVEKFIPHAIYRLTLDQYARVKMESYGAPPDDYIMVDGVPYVVGESAKTYAMNLRRGQARYTRDYYGVMVASVLARIYGQTTTGIHLFASHPPGHITYVPDIQQAAGGEWSVEYKGRHMTFNVAFVTCFPESAGGMYNVALNADGTGYDHRDVAQGRTLVLDVGQVTFDLMAFSNGQPDYAVRRSEDIGVGAALDSFESSIRNRYARELKKAVTIDPDILRVGLTTGWLEISGGRLDCQNEAAAATNQLINRISDAYQNLVGGGVNYRTIILTGGGSALLGDRLAPVLQHQNVWWAEEMNNMHLANVRGGWKFLQALRFKGVI